MAHDILSLSFADWKFRDAAGGRWLPSVVPGCVHRDLRRAGEIPDPFFGTNELGLQWIEERDWEYRGEFVVNDALLGHESVDLVADGLDTVARVSLNGRLVARTENMFVGHRWPVRALLRPGRNEITIRFDSAMGYIRGHRRGFQGVEFNDPVGRSQVIRKQACQFGWDWAPRLVTAGIWRDLRFEAWTGNRLDGLRVRQEHRPGGGCRLHLTPELVRRDPRVTVRYRLSLNDIAVARGTGTMIEVEHPQLWWPNGQGAQPLYQLSVEVVDAEDRLVGTWSRRLGLRTVELERRPDAAGETFRFVVNGRPVFAKGANWIPAHSFVAGLTRDDYARDLRAAAEAHMNMLRVWGGGIYESEDFYDLCDELGLLVWQDFMFACSIYPGDREFRRSVQAEAEQQVRRLRHRACLALWCGNNEIAQLNRLLFRRPRLRRDYESIFHGILPAAVAELDGVTAYWPSSQWRSNLEDSDAAPATYPAGEKRGDTHYWDVWHARQPVKDYERWRFRFVSEFGMQSYCSPETQATFCPPGDGNILGAVMENHQKNRAGNQIILDYVSRRYRFPRTQDDLVYLSQLNQAHCIQTGVNHYRRLMPHCMGALYWQLNDCWPAATWSSIEFTGRWRALHHLARRFYAPIVASAEVLGDETTIIGNYRRSDVRGVRLHLVSDRPEPVRGTLHWTLFHLDGRVLLDGSRRVLARPRESRAWKTLPLERLLARHGRDRVVLRFAWRGEDGSVSEDSVFVAPPRFLELRPGRVRVRVAMAGPRAARLTFTSAVFQHRFCFDLHGVEHRAADNYFELFPGEPRSIEIRLARAQTAARLRRALTWRSLADAG